MLVRDFPPGPRWFLGVIVEPGRVGICVVEGTDESDPAELGLGIPTAIYVFGEPITETEVLPVVQGMFSGTGPRLTDAFGDRLAGIIKVSKVPVLPGVH